MRQLLIVLSLLLLLAWRVPVHAANSHGQPDHFQEMGAWFGDALQAFVVSGCQPAVPSASLTLAAFSCAAYVKDTSKALAYVTQEAANVGSLNAGNGTYWLALFRDASTTVASWTRQVGTHYLWRAESHRPADPAGGLVFAQVTVTSGVITAVLGVAPASPVAANLAQVNVQDYATGGDGSVSRPWTGWERAFVALPNRSYVFGAGEFQLTAPITISQHRTHIRGAGKHATHLTYSPGADSNTGVFHFSKGTNAILFQCSLGALAIQTNDTTYRKVGVSLVDVSEFHMSDVVVGSASRWTGNTSRGMWIFGREVSTIERVELSGDIPIQISKNPNHAIDIDQFVFRDTYLLATCNNAWPVILIDGVNLTNVTFEGSNAWVCGSDGLRWIDSVSTATYSSLNLALRNIRWEQSTNANGYIIDIEGRGQSIQNVLIENVYGGAGTDHNGYKFLNVRGLKLQNVVYAGTSEALNINETNRGVTFESCFWQTGSTAQISSQLTPMWALSANGVSAPAPTHAVYGAATSLNQALTLTGLTFWQKTGTLASGDQTANLYPFGPGIQLATVIVSLSGATKKEGGQVVVDSSPAATLISGSANFGVGNVVGKFTVFQEGNQIKLFNQLGESVDYLVLVLKKP